MSSKLFLLAEKIKTLREELGWTQNDLARKLGLTRSSINGWEMGISVPSTQCVVNLAMLFNVSTDYLLGMSEGAKISVEGLDDNEVAVLVNLVECLRK